MEYKDYLLTDEWKKKRAAVLKRDGFRCVVCNSSEHFNVHHRTYERIFKEKLSDLTTLCNNCHTIFHKAEGLLHLIAEFVSNRSKIEGK